MGYPRDFGIEAIDNEIDRIHRELRRIEPICASDAESWQRAWDRHPEMRVQKSILMQCRAAAQVARDASRKAAASTANALASPVECPTCGCMTLMPQPNAMPARAALSKARPVE